MVTREGVTSNETYKILKYIHLSRPRISKYRPKKKNRNNKTTSRANYVSSN